MYNILSIQGMQWGDEGKGKITDFYSKKSDIIVRSNGGNNAGHTVVRNGIRYALQLLPSGILNPKAVNIIADGTVVSLSGLLEEIERIEKQGIKDFNLLISTRASIVMPYHQQLDKAKEIVLGKSKIGTTGKGIGPCYSDKAARLGLRIGNLIDKEYLKKRLEEVLPIKNIELKAFGIEEYTVEKMMEYFNDLTEKLLKKAKIIDTSNYLYNAIKEGKKILFEGAQGAMLSIDFGTYPYVTSSCALASAIPMNVGVPAETIKTDAIVGILKAYTTRVGEGPFPSEILDENANLIREKGHEYGTVTGRPRRIGWLDLAQVNFVVKISGVKHFALMLTDVLSVVDEIKICVGYEIDGKVIDYFPSNLSELYNVKPNFITMKSWKDDISNIRKFEDLPKECKDYVLKIEELTGGKVTLVSVGPDEEQTIVREELF
jgi:adenylosuccinate synthase